MSGKEEFLRAYSIGFGEFRKHIGLLHTNKQCIFSVSTNLNVNLCWYVIAWFIYIFLICSITSFIFHSPLVFKSVSTTYINVKVLQLIFNLVNSQHRKRSQRNWRILKETFNFLFTPFVFNQARNNWEEFCSFIFYVILNI